MKKSGNIFIISAPSGSGKTTIVEKFLKDFKDAGRSVSVTTRAPRAGEVRNRDYHFVAEKVFKKMAQRGALLEWAQNFGYYYGTPKKAVDSCLKKRKDIILTIDVKGAMQVKKKMPDSVLVFIMPPSMEELARRLVKRRTDRAKEISARLATAKKEIAQAKKYNYVIVNEKVEESVAFLEAIVLAKRCEVK